MNGAEGSLPNLLLERVQLVLILVGVLAVQLHVKVVKDTVEHLFFLCG